MSVFSTLNYVLGHPLNRADRFRAFMRFLRWQVGTVLLKTPVLVPYVNETHLLVSKGMTGATGSVYAGLQEYFDMAFVAHALEPSDLFVDVGANVGVYSILAASCGARVRAYEPVPSTYAALKLNVKINDFEDRIDARRVGVSNSSGQLSFTTAFDTVNHVLAGGEGGTNVDVVALDDECLFDQQVILKVDVEGYESNVLVGASSLLISGMVKAVVLELNGSGARYGKSDENVDATMRTLGFTSIQYDPTSRVLTPSVRNTLGNTIYVRDLGRVASICSVAPPIRVLGRKI